jgi:hypothetical protein
MMVRSGLAFMCLALSMAGCDKKNSTTESGSASASASAAVVSSSTPAGSWPASEERHHRCPTDLPGVTSTVADVDGGVALTITASDDRTVADIRERTTRAIDMSQRFGDAPQRGDGGGGGHRARCAAVMRGAKSDAKNIDGGTQITILATDAVDVMRVRADVRERLVHP